MLKCQKARRRTNRRTGQFLNHNFTLNISGDGAHAITAAQLEVPVTRPARVVFAACQFALKEGAQGSTFPLFSLAINDGNGDTDARSRNVMVGPTVQKAKVRAYKGLDFDHYSDSDPVVYFNINNMGTSNVITVNGIVRIQYQNANLPKPTTFKSTTLFDLGKDEASGSSLNEDFDRLSV